MITRRGLNLGLGVTLGATLGAGLLPGMARAESVKRLPITLSPGDKPLIQVTIEGKGPYTFLIDTGASISAVSDSIARELKLDWLPNRVRMSSIKGDTFNAMYRAKEIVMGGAIRMPAWEMAGLYNPPMPGVDGLLPASVLTALPCQLDYEAKELRYHMDGVMDVTGFTKLDAFFHAEPGSVEQAYVTVRLGGEKLVCCLDTGAGSSLYLYGEYVKAHKLWDKYPLLRETSNTGANGRVVKGRLVMAPEVSIGGIAMTQLPITLGDPADFLANGGRYHQGLLGSAVLSGYTLAFTSAKTVYVKRNGRPLAGS